MDTYQQNRNTSLKEIISYTLPELYVGKEWYVGFYAFDPVLGKMRRKKIKINFIKGLTKRRKYGEDLKKRVTEKLLKGWNPWIEVDNPSAYHTLVDVFSSYRKFLEKMTSDGNYRNDTYDSYTSYLRNIENWNLEQKVPVTYIFQFNEEFCSKFLEYVYIDRDNTIYTRNNYLGFIRTFSTWCIQQRYFKTNPVEGISNLGNRRMKKQRTIIAEADMIRLSEYLATKNKYFLLASYILTYCFIRPKEMTLIQLHHFSLQRQTLFVPDTVSKNRRDGTITLPSKVIRLMLDLNVFNNPTDCYLFSDGFMPGRVKRDPKMFRDFWNNYVRKDLKFPTPYKFYSLKDTGITSMLRKYDALTVRDQARHSSILMTDTYTPKDIQEANEFIKNHEGVF